MVSAAPNSNASALKRLRKSLSEAGAIGRNSRSSISRKQRKHGNPPEVGKDDLQRKLQVIKNAMNPYEVKTNKTKFDVLGRRIKGSTGRPGLTKQVGDDKRRKTLLVEIQNRNKAGGIVDRRIGENDVAMTPEEKMLERFTKERQKKMKSNGGGLFNLEDDEEDLTHYGQSLAGIDDFDDADLMMSDDDDKGIIDQKTVSRTHFGGFDPTGSDEDSTERKKSKSEVMREVIAKSKLHKYERQKEKEEDDTLRKDLDDELTDIRMLLDVEEKTRARKPLPPQSRVFEKVEQSDEAASYSAANSAKVIDDYEDYDRFVHELANDRRAAPTDRLKTEEELALEEKEKLEKAEKERKRRMEGLENDEESEEKERGKGRKKRRREPTADDLEDDFQESDAEEESLGKGLMIENILNADGIENGKADDNEKSIEDAGLEENDEEEWEEGSEDLSDIGILDENDSETSDDEGSDEISKRNFKNFLDDDINEFVDGKLAKKLVKKTASETGKMEILRERIAVGNVKSELPYTFACPSSHAGFLAILRDIDVSDHPTVVQRIRVLHHIKLAAENRVKLETFFDILLTHIVHLSTTITPFPSTVLNKLNAHLFQLSQQMPEHAVTCYQRRLKEMHEKMVAENRERWFDLGEIVVLRTLGHVFPTSDYFHLAVTPAMLLMTMGLELGRVKGEGDIARGLAVCALLWDFSIPGYFPIPDYEFPDFHITDGSLEPQLLDFQSLLGIDTGMLGEKDMIQVRVDLWNAVIQMWDRYCGLYASLVAFVEVWEPIRQCIRRVDKVGLHETLKKRLDTLEEKLARQIKFAKERRRKAPIRMQHHKPIPLATHVPKFEESYSIDKHYDADASRAEFTKLKSQLKKEKKAAIRELRKDSMFVAREKLKMIKEKDQKYKQYVKGVMSVLEQEQGEKNMYERELKKEGRK